MRLSDKAGHRGGIEAQNGFAVGFTTSLHLRSEQAREFKTAYMGSGSPIGDCEPPRATGQEMTITKVTNRGGPSHLRNHLGNHASASIGERDSPADSDPRRHAEVINDQGQQIRKIPVLIMPTV